MHGRNGRGRHIGFCKLFHQRIALSFSFASSSLFSLNPLFHRPYSRASLDFFPSTSRKSYGDGIIDTRDPPAAASPAHAVNISRGVGLDDCFIVTIIPLPGAGCSTMLSTINAARLLRHTHSPLISGASMRNDIAYDRWNDGKAAREKLKVFGAKATPAVYLVIFPPPCRARCLLYSNICIMRGALPRFSFSLVFNFAALARAS